MYLYSVGLPWCLSDKEPACQYRRLRRHDFNPWVGKISWRRKWQPTLVFLSGKSHAQRSLTGYSPRDHKRVWHKLATQQQQPIWLAGLKFSIGYYQMQISKNLWIKLIIPFWSSDHGSLWFPFQIFRYVRNLIWICRCVYSALISLCALSVQSYLTLCDPMGCSSPGSSVQGIFQTRILECVAISSSRRSSRPRSWTHISYVSCIGMQIL